MIREQIRFQGSEGRRLAGLLSAPSSGVKGWFLASHCFTCNKNYKVLNALARVLNARGYGVLRYDCAGLGESEGAFEDTNFTTNLDDMQGAVAYLRERFGGPDFLLGHSLGGSAALGTARHIPSLKGVVTIGTSFEPARLKRLFHKHQEALAAGPEQTVSVRVAGRDMPFKKQFVDDLERHNLENEIAKLRVPLLIIHSRSDEITPFENAERIFAAAPGPKRLVTLEDVDHLVSDRAEAESVGGLIADWADEIAKAG
jgi:uncharacterized protein